MPHTGSYSLEQLPQSHSPKYSTEKTLQALNYSSKQIFKQKSFVWISAEKKRFRKFRKFFYRISQIMLFPIQYQTRRRGVLFAIQEQNDNIVSRNIVLSTEIQTELFRLKICFVRFLIKTYLWYRCPAHMHVVVTSIRFYMWIHLTHKREIRHQSKAENIGP